ncbi:MAG TPA: TOBE-like domain-containing protein, partial [Solirubrobacterales bacterium]|nr:TOBE-like domain-containing protein [Solirubrobacterales bacterium]
FVGEVNRIGGHLVRPHDMEIARHPAPDTEEGMVQRIVALGFEVRVEFILGDGTEVWAQLTRTEFQELELAEKQIVHLRADGGKRFATRSAA